MNSAVALLLGFVLAQGPEVGKVDREFDKKVNFASLHTYAWTTGTDAFSPDAHKMIVAAFESEMAKLGFTKVTTAADVTVSYHTFMVAKVDLKALDKMEREGKAGATPTKALGRLAVIMRNASTHEQIWSASMREYLDPDRAKLGDTIQSVTATLFSTYPGRKPSR